MKVKHEQFELSPEHEIINEREREADESKEPGKSWEEVERALEEEMVRLTVRPLAQNDIQGIIDYYDEINPEISENFERTRIDNFQY